MALDAPRSTSASAAAPAGRLAAVAAAAIPCLPFLPLLLAGETLWFRDFSLYFVPMKALLADLWRAGGLPLWDPHVRNGLPFLANPQTGVFYPPSVLLVALGLDPGLTLFLLLHLAAAGLGLHLFLRACGFAPLAALAGGIAFALGGYVASLVNVLNNLQAAAWIPWLLLFSVRLARADGPSRAAWMGLATAAALTVLGGELQLAALGFALALAVPLALDGPAAVRGTEDGSDARGPAAPRRRRALRSWAAITAALAAGTALCAVQLVPTLELLRESVRSAGLPFELAARDSLDPRAIATLAFPQPAVPGTATGGARLTGRMPWLLSAYAGLVVVWLAAAGLGRPRARWSAFWCATAALGVILALGSRSPLFRLAYDALPAFRAVRYPEKFLLLPALAAPLLAAAGIERLLAGKLGPRRAAAGLALVSAAALAALAFPAGGGRAPAAEAATAALLAAAGCGVVLFASIGGRLVPARAAAILVGLVALDLAGPARAVNPSVPWRFYEPPWAARVLEARGEDPRTFRIRASPPVADMEQVALLPRARVFSNHYLFAQSLAPNLAQLHGWLQQDGGSGIETNDTAELIDLLREQDPAGRLRVLRLLGVRYLVTSLPLEAGPVRTVAAHPELPVEIVRLDGALPRAYVVEDVEVVAERKAALRRAADPAFPAASRVVLSEAPPRPPALPASRPRVQGARSSGAVGGAHGPGGAAPQVVHQAWSAAGARFVVEAPRGGILVVTDSHYPGWVARVDGGPARLLRANGYLRAVPVPAGRHVVEMDYRPASLAWGAAGSGVAALLVGAGLFATGRRRRAGRPDAGSTGLEKATPRAAREREDLAAEVPA